MEQDRISQIGSYLASSSLICLLKPSAFSSFTALATNAEVRQSSPYLQSKSRNGEEMQHHNSRDAEVAFCKLALGSEF